MPRTIAKETTATEIVDACLTELSRRWAEYHEDRDAYVEAMKSGKGQADAHANYMNSITNVKDAHRELKTAFRNIIKNHQL